MPIATLLPLAGKLNATLCAVPFVGEPLVRTQNRLFGKIAFHLPVMGAHKCTTIDEVKQQWLSFLSRVGIHPRIVDEKPNSFAFQIDACAYGFDRPEQQQVCDACMDFDRVFVKHLGAELVIEHSIPQGAAECRCVVRMS